MKFLTDEKLVISGAGGMIGSNMAQTAIMMGLTSNICLYDVYMPGLEGVVEELRHCSFPGVNITYTDKVEEAFTGAKYMVSSGGAPRKAGMTREDLLVGNANIEALCYYLQPCRYYRSCSTCLFRFETFTDYHIGSS